MGNKDVLPKLVDYTKVSREWFDIIGQRDNAGFLF